MKGEMPKERHKILFRSTFQTVLMVTLCGNHSGQQETACWAQWKAISLKYIKGKNLVQNSNLHLLPWCLNICMCVYTYTQIILISQAYLCENTQETGYRGCHQENWCLRVSVRKKYLLDFVLCISITYLQNNLFIKINLITNTGEKLTRGIKHIYIGI